jgi:hypothetical protein
LIVVVVVEPAGTVVVEEGLEDEVELDDEVVVVGAAVVVVGAAVVVVGAAVVVVGAAVVVVGTAVVVVGAAVVVVGAAVVVVGTAVVVVCGTVVVEFDVVVEVVVDVVVGGSEVEVVDVVVGSGTVVVVGPGHTQFTQMPSAQNAPVGELASHCSPGSTMPLPHVPGDVVVVLVLEVVDVEDVVVGRLLVVVGVTHAHWTQMAPSGQSNAPVGELVSQGSPGSTTPFPQSEFAVVLVVVLVDVVVVLLAVRHDGSSRNTRSDFTSRA